MAAAAISLFFISTSGTGGVFFPHSLTGMIGEYQAGFNRQLSNNAVIASRPTFLLPTPLDHLGLFRTLQYHHGLLGHRAGPRWLCLWDRRALCDRRCRLGPDSASTSVIPMAVLLGQIQLQRLGYRGSGSSSLLGGNWVERLNTVTSTSAAGPMDLMALPFRNRALIRSFRTLKLGLNYKLWDTPPWDRGAVSNGQPVASASTDWNVHGQTTVIAQGYPRFRSPYQGTNSLPGGGQARETWTVDAFLGWRLWEGGEFYFNPELAQGFGIGTTLGLAGFSNGEAQKGGGDFPKFRPQRYFFPKAFGLGGERKWSKTDRTSWQENAMSIALRSRSGASQ